jgi:6,7-dimethyl-8-ribityllumazine synthase
MARRVPRPAPRAKQPPPARGEAAGLSLVVVASRFNGAYVEPMIESALTALEERGLERSRVRLVRVPGAFELPLVAREIARRWRPDGIVALGAVIRGETPHFDFVAAETARGLMQASLETGVPVSFGVVTANDVAQAEARSRPPLDRGAEAARACVETARALASLRVRRRRPVPR